MNAYIILGVNGSGKTTYFRDNLKDNFSKKNILSINADEIKISLVEQGMDSELAKIKSGQIAISKIGECIKNKQSFSLETTFTDDGVMGSVAVLKELKKAGFNITGYNVFTDNVNLNIQRVRDRFIKGIGHFVPENIIRYRVEKYNQNISNYSDLFDTLNHINNSNLDFKKSDMGEFYLSRIVNNYENVNTKECFKIHKEEFSNNEDSTLKVHEVSQKEHYESEDKKINKKNKNRG